MKRLRLPTKLSNLTEVPVRFVIKAKIYLNKMVCYVPLVTLYTAFVTTMLVSDCCELKVHDHSSILL